MRKECMTFGKGSTSGHVRLSPSRFSSPPTHTFGRVDYNKFPWEKIFSGRNKCDNYCGPSRKLNESNTLYKFQLKQVIRQYAANHCLCWKETNRYFS